MPAYALANLRRVEMGPGIAEYLERIDGTLEPFGGRFIVHGGEVEVLEGAFAGDLIVIEFPSREAARTWYRSPAYQAILRLRTDHSEGDVVIVDGVGEGHKATDVLGPAR